jgi:hypothetical protein
MTVVELLVTSSVLVILLGMVLISVTLINDVSNNVSSQYQEFNQALPALAPFHTLLAAQIEPGPPVAGVPQPPFECLSSNPTCTAIGNFTMTFFANIGTGYGDVMSCPSSDPGCTSSSAGPAMIVAGEYDESGNPVTVGAGGTNCDAATPCSLQVRLYLPQTVSNGAPSCPILWGSTLQWTACSYSTTYRLLANVGDVVNNPSAVGSDGTTPTQPIFSYGYFDPGYVVSPTLQYYTQSHILTATEVQNQSMSLSGLGYGGTATSQSLTNCAAVSTNYPTPAVACPADSIQSVGLDLMLARPGVSGEGAVEDRLVVYRYAESPGSSTYPYQYSETNG